jgi:hypothetical protein
VAFAIKMVIRLVCAPKLLGPPRSSGMVMQWMVIRLKRIYNF